MLILLAALLSCALAQSTTGTTLTNATKDIRALTINQNPTLLPFQPSGEDFFLFITSNANKGNYLRRTDDANANGEPVQRLLSHADIPLPGVATVAGVGEAQLSPDDSYVLFSAAIAAPDAFQHYTVSSSGGTITRITPNQFPVGKTTSGVVGAALNRWNFPPCQTGGQRSDIFVGQWETALSNSAGGGVFSSELWVNNRNGDAKRISINAGQAQDDRQPVKTLVSRRADYDYIFYTLNPGPDNINSNVAGVEESNAPRNLYMTNYNGDNWQISPSPTLALANTTAFAISRSNPGCGSSGVGRYVAVEDIVVVKDAPDIYAYDVTTKARVGTATLNPAGTAGCSLVNLNGEVGRSFVPDESGFVFQCQVSTTDANKDLYFYKTLGTGAATKISVAYPAVATPPAVGRSVGMVSIQGDYLFWRQPVAPGTGAEQRGLVAYNWKTGATATLFTETDLIKLTGTQQYADVESDSFTEAGAGLVGSATTTSTPYVWFDVTDSTVALSVKTSYYRAAFNGAAGSAAQVADTVSVGGLEARSCTGCGGTNVNTDTCKANVRGCQSSPCCQRKCSGWVTFTGVPVVAGSGQTQIYSAKHDGTSVTVTALATTECAVTDPTTPIAPVIWRRSVGHPFTKPLLQYVYFTATTGVVGSEVQNLHAVQAGSATVINIGTPAPVARGGVIIAGGGVVSSSICTVPPGAVQTALTGSHSRPALSPDGKWILYQSQTVANNFATAPALVRPGAETFLAIADGSAAPKKIGPAVNADYTGGNNPQIQFNSDGSFAIFALRSQFADTAAAVPAFFTSNRQRDQLWSVQVSSEAVPKTYNLTAIVNVPLGNPVRSAGNVAFHPCNNQRLVFTTKYPEDASPQGIYSVLVTGGNTVRLSHDPNVNAPATSYTFLSTREALRWSTNYPSPALVSTDVFINRAGASIVAPLLTILALVLVLLH